MDSASSAGQAAMESRPEPPAPDRRRSKACVNCVRIKCKCIPLGNGDGCQRCYRLSKTCVPSPAPTTSKRAAASAGRPRRLGSRTQRLEAKLSDLVNLLRTTQGIDGGGGSGSGGGDGGAENQPSPVRIQGPEGTPQTSATMTTAGRESDENYPSEAEAEKIFRRFREKMLPLEPVVFFALGTTAQQLQHDAPFLWLCIMAVAAVSVEQRWGLGSRARHQLLDRVVAGGERNLSALHGILVLLAWFHVLPAVDRQFAVLLSQLSVAVAWDLGLAMSLPLEQRGPGLGALPGSGSGHALGPESGGSGLTAAPCRAPAHLPACKRERTTEERRAILAVFSVTSSVPLMPDGLRWSPYLEDCLAHLVQQRAEGSDSATQDAVLIRHVRLRLLGSQMRHETAWSNASATTGSSTWRGSFTPTAPAILPLTLLESAQLYLDSIVDDPVSLDNFATHNIYHHTRLTVHESVLMRPPPPGAPFDLHRLTIYQRCLDSVRQTFDHFFSYPPDRYLCLPCGSVCLLLYVAVCLHRLTTLRDPSWSVEAVRDTIDLIPTVDRVIATFQDCQRQMMTMSQTSSTTPSSATSNTADGSHGASPPDEPSLSSPAENVVATFAIRKFQALRSVWLSELPPRNSTTATTNNGATVLSAPLAPFPSEPPPIPIASLDSSPSLLAKNLSTFDYYQWLPDLAMDLSWM